MHGIEQEYLQAGSVLGGRYEVLRLLGKGGMGSVLLVSDRALQNTQVVLKFLHPTLVPDEQQFLRFQNEVMLMRELNHPNIVRTYDIGQVGKGLYYLSMEYVKGETLGSLLASQTNKKLSFKTAAPILYDIACGLAHAHTKGIIHRDLKPDNILINVDGEVKITDFGLAKALQADVSLTNPGEAVGTPFYMAPEQLQGKIIDQRTDIYSFGIVVFEMFAGYRPFSSPAFLELAKQHLHNKIPAFTNKSDELPNWVQDFVEKCCAKNPANRFSSFTEILEILAPCLKDPERPPSGNSRSSRGHSISRHWRLKWRLRHPKKAIYLGLTSSLIISLVILFAVGRNNQVLRRIYGPTLLRFEHRIGLDLPRIRLIFLGPKHDKTRLTVENAVDAITEAREPELIELMLIAGLNPNLRDKYDRTLVELAVMKESPEIIEMLIYHGADLTVENRQRQTLLIRGAKQQAPQVLGSLLRGGNSDLMKIDAKDSYGKPALLYAIENGDVASFDLLVHAGASIHVIDDTHKTPTMYAVEAGSIELLNRILAKTGSSGINNKNKNGLAALHLAADRGNLQAVKQLLAYGADPMLLNAEGKSALLISAQRGQEATFSYFFENYPALRTLKDNSGQGINDFLQSE